MLTFGELRQTPKKLDQLQGHDALVAAADETVVQNARSKPEATVVFQHETIKMMKAERAERLEKLRALLSDTSAVIPLRKKPESFWDHITLGRVSTADIVLHDKAISNVHAHFALNHDGHPVSVQDVGSSNGTHLNREQLQPHALYPLQTGDCIRFGQTIFYYLRHSALKDLLGLG